MRIISTLVFIFIFSTSYAQGIYQIWSPMIDGNGAQFGMGAIFSTDTSGNNYKTRHLLESRSSGGRSMYESPVAFNGKLYAMTSEGGSYSKGTIIQFDPITYEYIKKIDFNGTNGSGPKGGLVLSGNKFYGMTWAGGARDSGTIFEYDPVANILSKKADLNTAKGAFPAGNLTIYNGKFYGMTTSGGTNNKGVIFEWDPITNLFTKKQNLSIANGSNPYGSLTVNGTMMYGMTNSGGINNAGVIFEYDPLTNVYSKKIDFNGTDGGGPYGSLTLKSGKLYGMTLNGGPGGAGSGVIFEYDPVTNIYTKKQTPAYANGSNPYGNLTLLNDIFYGVMSYGTGGYGVIFEWNPATNIYTTKFTLTGATGSKPYGSMLFHSGKFYGLTFAGGTYNLGVIFDWDPASNEYNNRYILGKTENERRPLGHLVACGGKWYGLNDDDLLSGTGAIFEWNPSTGLYANVHPFKDPDGFRPTGSMTELNGKLYGVTSVGGANFKGVIFEFNPATREYIKKYDFSEINGSNPVGALTLFNNKFYGVTMSGGDDGGGVIFEWDPATNLYTRKISFTWDAGTMEIGATPAGGLTVYNGKLYGTTSQGGGVSTPMKGVIFEFDPVTNVFIKKHAFNGFTGLTPVASMTVYNNKLYGVTSEGGINNVGVLYEFDPATSTTVGKIVFGNNNGNYPQGEMLVLNDNLYGMTRTGGSFSRGMLFQWNPATNILTKKKDFDANNAWGPNGNELKLFTAPVAKGTPGSCAAMNTITINSSNNNIWVPITDANGDAVAEIKANGNNLGTVTTSMYINNKMVREDGSNRLYLDRNLSITPQVQPTSNVDIRLYLRQAEFEALKIAYNSLNQSSGVNTINDLAFFKNSESCQAAILNAASPVQVTGAAWENDYVLTASINQFSSFYIANKVYVILPVNFLSFDAVLQGNNAMLEWKTENEINAAAFEVERSFGASFEKIGITPAINSAGRHSYHFADVDIASSPENVVYYRLKQVDADGRFVYSRTIALQLLKNKSLAVYPNPSHGIINVLTTDKNMWNTNAVITDVQGKTIWSFLLKNNKTTIDIGQIEKGVYFLKMENGEAIKIIKQ